MDTMKYWLRLIDAFQTPFTLNFEEGLLQKGADGSFKVRDSLNPFEFGEDEHKTRKNDGDDLGIPKEGGSHEDVEAGIQR